MPGRDAARMFDGSAEWIMIGHAIGGPIGGRLVIAVRRKDVDSILKTLLGSVPANWQNDEYASSAIREVSNILTSYFLSVLGQFFGQVLVPGVPEMVMESPQALADSLSQRSGILVETNFHEKGGETLWYMFVLPEPDAMSSALDNLLKRHA
jgi:chemotaxis protein CheY-P-specific phosphatase CheC